MKVRSWIPMFFALAAFGCGTEEGVLGPVAGSNTEDLSAEQGQSSPGAVYSMTNAPGGNEVLAFERSSDGSLGAPRTFPTGGLGTGAGLGNQGSLALGDGNRWLYVVNAGSNDVSAFRVRPSGLQLVDREPSGGERPVSVTAHHDLLYVLNAGGTGGIQGFRISPSGQLTPIAGSNLALSGDNAAAAQIGFTPDGTRLVVTEKATNVLSIYQVAPDGSASGPVVQPSSGPTPFGFGFDQNRTLVVSEAFGGAQDLSAISSYRVGHDGSVSLVSGSVPTDQTAACWIAVQGDGRFAFTTNAGSSSITGFVVGNDGSLARIEGEAGRTPTADGPTEMSFSNGSRYLYVLNGRAAVISAYAVDAAGDLTAVGGPTAIPAGMNGLAAR